MAQLVEHHLAKVGVAGSNPVVRSRSSCYISPALLSITREEFLGGCTSAGRQGRPLDRLGRTRQNLRGWPF